MVFAGANDWTTSAFTNSQGGGVGWITDGGLCTDCAEARDCRAPLPLHRHSGARVARTRNPSGVSVGGGMDSGLALRAPRNDENTRPRSRGMKCPKFCRSFRPREFRGRRECRGAHCTRGLVRVVHEKWVHTSIQSSGGTPTFPAQWLYGLWRALPGEQLFCLRSALQDRACKWIDASTATSGPHAFAVRFNHARLAQHRRPPHPCPTFVTCARPSDRDRMPIVCR